jgi:hypothetical protein
LQAKSTSRILDASESAPRRCRAYGEATARPKTARTASKAARATPSSSFGSSGVVVERAVAADEAATSRPLKRARTVATLDSMLLKEEDGLAVPKTRAATGGEVSMGVDACTGPPAPAGGLDEEKLRKIDRFINKFDVKLHSASTLQGRPKAQAAVLTRAEAIVHWLIKYQGRLARAGHDEMLDRVRKVLRKWSSIVVREKPL